MSASRDALTDHLIAKECVRFKLIPRAFMIVVNVLLQAGLKFREEIVLTGVSYEDYPPEGIHNQGYAWDVRTWNWKHPDTVVSWITKHLVSVDHRYRTVYGDENHLDHVHIEYRYYLTR